MRALILVIAVIVIGAGSYWLWGPTSNVQTPEKQTTAVTPTPATTTASDNEPVNNDTEIITNTAELETFLAKGGTVQCEYESRVKEVTNSGTMYFDTNANTYRIDGTTTMGEETLETQMLVRDSTLYTWGTSPVAGEVAYQMALPEEAGPSEFLDESMEMPEAADSTTPADTSVRYECFAAELSADLFTLPEGVEFTSMSDMMPAQSGM